MEKYEEYGYNIQDGKAIIPEWETEIKKGDLTKMFPRLTCLITINRGSRNAKDGVFYERSIKCVSKNVVRIWL